MLQPSVRYGTTEAATDIAHVIHLFQFILQGEY
jgi:hypothetical protein